MWKISKKEDNKHNNKQQQWSLPSSMFRHPPLPWACPSCLSPETDMDTFHRKTGFKVVARRLWGVGLRQTHSCPPYLLKKKKKNVHPIYLTINDRTAQEGSGVVASNDPPQHAPLCVYTDLCAISMLWYTDTRMCTSLEKKNKDVVNFFS